MKKIWYFLIPLFVCLLLPLPRASAASEEKPSYTEDGFTAVERDDGYLKITAYEGELAEDGKLEIPATIQNIEVKEISSLFGTNTTLRNAVTSVRLPDGLQKLGSVFQKCVSLESVYIPGSLEEVTSPFAPFADCAKLTNVEFGVDLPRVPAYLFNGCTGLTSIELPKQTTIIGDYAFQKCTNLESITFHTSNYLTTIGTFAFQGCTALKGCQGSTTLTLPDGLRTVGASAFAGCTALQELDMPKTLRTLGDSAFANCTALNKVLISASLTAAGSASYPVFAGCSALNDVSFREGVTSIIANLFAKCNGLKQITIPGTVASIGEGAFNESGLTSIEIPNNVTSYGSKAFRKCTQMTDATLSSKAPLITEQMFYQCYALKTVNLDDPEAVTSIAKEAFYECKRLTTLPHWEALTSIGASAFFRCEELPSIFLPECLISLGAKVFQYDAKLNKVVIPSMITEIPQYAFAQCYALTDIVIPKSVRAIGPYAFYQDTGLLRVFIPASVKDISDDEAFSYVDKMTIEGVKGSYAEDWADRNGALSFVDKSTPIETITLVGGKNSLILPKSSTFAPVFDVTPADNTDVITLESSSTSVTVKNGYILSCSKTLTEPITITATATSGKSFEFTVTCDNLSGLKITPPQITDYVVGDSMNWTGFQVEAVFNSGATQTVYNYPPNADTIRDKILEWTSSGFDSQTVGEQDVKVSYGSVSETFPVKVFASASELPLILLQVQRTEKSLLVRTHGAAGDAKCCAITFFDANGQFLRTDFNTLSAANISDGFANFSVFENAASAKVCLLNGNTLAPAQILPSLSLSQS